MSPKKHSTPITEPKTLTTRLDRRDDEKLEKLLLEARFHGVLSTSYSKSDFIRDAIIQQMERLEGQLRAAGSLKDSDLSAGPSPRASATPPSSS